MRKQATLTVTMVAVVALTVMLTVGTVYAQDIVLTPSTVTQGMSVQASSSGLSGSGTVFVWATSTCSGTEVLSVPFVTAGGSYTVTFSTSTLSVGTHCVSDGDSEPAILTVTTTVTTTTAAPPIPEYPLGLPILAILAVIGYGLIRRRTRIGHQ